MQLLNEYVSCAHVSFNVFITINNLPRFVTPQNWNLFFSFFLSRLLILGSCLYLCVSVGVIRYECVCECVWFMIEFVLRIDEFFFFYKTLQHSQTICTSHLNTQQEIYFNFFFSSLFSARCDDEFRKHKPTAERRGERGNREWENERRKRKISFWFLSPIFVIETNTKII